MNNDQTKDDCRFEANDSGKIDRPATFEAKRSDHTGGWRTAFYGLLIALLLNQAVWTVAVVIVIGKGRCNG